MNQIVLDDAIVPMFASAHEHLELVSSSGRKLGVFVPECRLPAAKPDTAIYEWAKSQISDEELDRRAKSTNVFTTAEVLSRLTER